MRRTYGSAVALAAIALLPSIAMAQMDQESSRKVAGGGISVAGWAGKIDAKEEKAGQVLANSKLAVESDMKDMKDMKGMKGKKGKKDKQDKNKPMVLRVTTGPAVTYWSPANKATGNYTVKATFNEADYMGLNDHPHPYGIVIGGNDMGTDNQSYLYCAAYGNGNFIVRGMGPAPFQVNGRGEANEAVHKAAGKGSAVSQEIAVSVKGDKVECAINGTVVGSYDKASLVTTGKLKSTDGVYGIRFAHNTEATVTGLTITKN